VRLAHVSANPRDTQEVSDTAGPRTGGWGGREGICRQVPGHRGPHRPAPVRQPHCCQSRTDSESGHSSRLGWGGAAHRRWRNGSEHAASAQSTPSSSTWLCGSPVQSFKNVPQVFLCLRSWGLFLTLSFGWKAIKIVHLTQSQII
jgi:hypothetical protein